MKSISKYWAIFKTTLLNQLAYPGELIGRGLMILPFMWIFHQLWKATFAASGTDSLNGLTLHDTLWYLMLAETIELSRSFVARVISENVKDGSIAYVLNKPYDFILYQFSQSMGESVSRAALCAFFGGAAVWQMVGAPPDPRGWIFASIAIFGSWTLNFCIACLIGLMAFVTEDVSAFIWIYQKFAFILGGLIIPLDFYPIWLQRVAKLLPFSAMTYGPARLFVSPSFEAFANVILMQAIWCVALGAALVFFYRRGIASLTLNGG